MLRAGSVIALPIAMAMLRKNWSLPAIKARTSASSSPAADVRASHGAISRKKRLVQATLR